MQTKPKSNQVITTELLEGGILRVTVLGAGHVEFDPAKASDANRDYAEYHGWKQRLSDAAALGRNPETGQSASPADKLAAIQALATHYMSGSADWSPARAEGGNEGGITLRALARVQGVEVETMRARVAEQAEKRGITPKAYLARVAGAEAVIRAIAAIRAESGDAKAADDLLADLTA